jgi:hypothetical protein
MNAVQDEIMAIESTLGAKPHVYNPGAGTTTTYSSVASRLNTIQQSAAVQQAQVNTLLDASTKGWNLPIANVSATGTIIPPTINVNTPVPSDWYRLKWSDTFIDTDGVYTPGYLLTIPKSGWWIITANVVMANNRLGSPNVEHTVWARLTASGQGQPAVGFELAGASTSSAEKAGDWHRLSFSSGDAMFAGDRLVLEARHAYVATDSGPHLLLPLSAYARVQLTYIRALPPGLPGRTGLHPSRMRFPVSNRQKDSWRSTR